MTRAEFHCDFELGSVNVGVESGAFRGRSTVTLHEDDVRRLRRFLSALEGFPLQRSTVEITEPGTIFLAAGQSDRVGHLQLLVEVSDRLLMARVAIRLDHAGLELFRLQLGKMLDGELETFDVMQSTT